MKWDPREVQGITEEVSNLERAWQIFIDDQENGQNSNLHFPPALILASGNAFEAYAENGATLDFNDLDRPCVTTPRTILNFGAQMFEFAQRAARLGILASNLTPCKCLEVSDEDIAELMGKKDDGKTN